MHGSLRTSRQKKTIRKTDSPSQGGGGGVCFSIFKCCNQPPANDRDVETRIEEKNSKKKNGKKVQVDSNPPEVIDVSEAN